MSKTTTATVTSASEPWRCMCMGVGYTMRYGAVRQPMSQCLVHVPVACLSCPACLVQLMSKLVINNVCQSIEVARDHDAARSKPGFRALMVILGKVRTRGHVCAALLLLHRTVVHSDNIYMYARDGTQTSWDGIFCWLCCVSFYFALRVCVCVFVLIFLSCRAPLVVAVCMMSNPNCYIVGAG